MRILIVDINIVTHWHFHAKDPHWEYHVIEKLREICVRFSVDRVIISQDGGYDYRTKIYPGYKKNRATTRSKWTEAEQKTYGDFRKASFSFAKDVLPLTGFKTIRVQGCESDDLVAYLARHLDKTKHQILVLSGDKDYYQMLEPNVVIASYVEIKKEVSPLPASVWMNAKKFEEKYSLSVAQWIHAKSLQGDNGDGVSGAATKLGEVTATKLLQKYGTIENIKANKDNLDIPRMAQITKDTLNFDTVDLNYKVMNLNHTPEEELAIIGQDGIDTLNGVIADLEKPAELDTTTFTEMCYEKGWLTFVEQEDFFQPFYGKINNLDINKY